MPRITINGFEMHYEDAGSGPPVVYIHGGFASLDTALVDSSKLAWTWEKDFAGFHFIAYDRRGCYRSSCPQEGYELTNQAHDLEGLLDHLGIGSAHVIASSAGGPIGVTFAATAPKRVRSLLLVGTGLNLFPRSDPIADLVRQQILTLACDGAEAAFDQRPTEVQVSFKVLWEQAEMAERGTLQKYREEQRALARQAAELPKAERVRRYAAELRSMQAYMNADTSAYAKRVAVPTLVLHGDHDREVPLAWAEEMARMIPNAELRVMQGASHGLVIRYPEARHLVKEWIARIERTVIDSMTRGDAMTDGRRAEAFLGLLVVILLVTWRWEDSPTGKLISIAVSAIGLIGVVWLRRQLARVWIEIYTITFAGIALILIVNMLFLS